MREAIVPAGAVNELLGIREPVDVLPREFGVNLRKLTITDPLSPGYGEWVDRRAVLSWLEQSNEATGGHPIVERMIHEYREVMGL